jgi:thioester reductase-like protein
MDDSTMPTKELTMPHAVLMTGFPGFIATRLVDRLLADGTERRHFHFLVQRRFLFEAAERCRELEDRHPDFIGRWRVLEGDITRPRLGMTDSAWERVQAQVVECWHLAALYDLSAEQALSYRVNVEGTLHVLDLCEALPRFERLFYVSTCYVSGDRRGRVYEDELDRGQGFKNHYESTKFWAEKHVRCRMSRIPTTIFRPSIVVGDSVTGEIAKGDGPYFVLGLLSRLPRWLPFVKLGRSAAPVNLVPVDYVVDAMARLSTLEESEGRTFQLADPRPHTAAELTEMFCSILGRAPVVATVPDWLAARAIDRRWVCEALGIPRESFDYFDHPVEYDTGQTAELLSLRREPPPELGAYLSVLADYAAAHPEIHERGAA